MFYTKIRITTPEFIIFLQRTQPVCLAIILYSFSYASCTTLYHAFVRFTIYTHAASHHSFWNCCGCALLHGIGTYDGNGDEILRTWDRSPIPSSVSRSFKDLIPILYDVYDLCDLAHVAGWDKYNLHDLAQVSWVGSVLIGDPAQPLTTAGEAVSYTHLTLPTIYSV